MIDPTLFCRSFEHWVMIHAEAKHVITNRLHSAIVSCLLGKKVTLLPNSYHKNRAVWEYSLSGLGVNWQEGFKQNKILQLLDDISFTRIILRSRRWRHLIARLYRVSPEK